MARYYFVPAALPSLILGAKPEISFKEFRDLLSLNLTESDFSRFEMLLLPIDLYNIKAFWLGLPLDERGTVNAQGIEEALLVRDSLPEYFIDFLEEHDSVEERLRYFPSLYAQLFQREFRGFLAKYFQMERETRLILTALRAKRAGIDVVRQLQFEDPNDPLVSQILSQKDSPEYFPPGEFEDLKTLFVENSAEPRKLSFALLQYKFARIQEMEEGENFTLEQIMGYGARLLIVESWDQLDRERGNMAVEELSRYG